MARLNDEIRGAMEELKRFLKRLERAWWDEFGKCEVCGKGRIELIFLMENLFVKGEINF